MKIIWGILFLSITAFANLDNTNELHINYTVRESVAVYFVEDAGAAKSNMGEVVLEEDALEEVDLLVLSRASDFSVRYEVQRENGGEELLVDDAELGFHNKKFFLYEQGAMSNSNKKKVRVNIDGEGIEEVEEGIYKQDLELELHNTEGVSGEEYNNMLTVTVTSN